MRTEEEQLEELKRWWKKYAGPLIAGLVIGLALVFGTRAWIDHQEQQRVSASAEYAQLQNELAAGNTDAVAQRGAHLIDSYGRTPYATLAALALAMMHVEQGELAAARERLQWALDNSDVPELTHIARLRLARVLAAEGQASQALTLLPEPAPDGFAASYEELRGDLYADTGDIDRAREAYENALRELGFGAGAEIVQMKLDDLGTQG